MLASFPAQNLDLTKSYSCELFYNNFYVSRSYNIQLINEGGSNNNNSGAWKSGENLGVITNESGEKTGNIDLTPIIQGMGEINDNIVSGNQAIVNKIESGEEKAEERDNFWKNVYNNLFVIESGEVERKIENFTENLNIETESGELESMKTILNEFTKEPGDFIIEWKDVNWRNKTIISGDLINFNQLEREIPALGNIMSYVRLLMGYSILIVFGCNLWDTTLAILGVSRSIYEDHEEEKARLDDVEITDINASDGTFRQTIISKPKKGKIMRIHYPTQGKRRK